MRYNAFEMTALAVIPTVWHPDITILVDWAENTRLLTTYPVCVSGMLLRFFVNMYDQEIIEEEAFLHWKEEVNDEYPGKGKALFQVNNNYGLYVLFSSWGT